MSVLCKNEEIIVDTTEYNSDEADENIRLTLEDSGGENYHSSYHSSEQHHNNSSSPPRQRIQHISSGQHHHLNVSTGKVPSKSVMENEKRMRREIANSNERRRMQSINAGFQSLRSLLPHHEGEKLSKAAILQQTAQYIIELEREKTHLLSQNSQLKRVLGQNEGGNGVGGGGGCGEGGGGDGVGGGNNDTNTGVGGGAIKKRKLTDPLINIQTISDSSDEGLGSMSPEPITLLNNQGKIIGSSAVTNFISNNNTKELNELKSHLESERKRRTILEERLRQLEQQIYPNQFQHHEVIEHTDNVRDEDISIMDDSMKLQVVEIDSLPSVQQQVVVCSDIGDLQVEETETITEEIIQEDMGDDMSTREETEEYVEVHVDGTSLLQPILEAAIKAEPKVEVERINATLTKIKEEPQDKKDGGKSGNSRMYLTSTSRQNLETIVEAIRHLEGDHLFGDMAEQKKAARQAQQQKHLSQDVPLALTNKRLPVELSPYLKIKPANCGTNLAILGSSTSGTTGLPVGVVATNTSCNNSNNSNNLNSSHKGTSSINNNNNSNTNTNNNSSINTNISNVTVSTLKSPLSLSSSSSTLSSSSVTMSGVTSGTLTIPQHQIQTTGTKTVTIAATLKQCRPGVIVAKQIS